MAGTGARPTQDLGATPTVRRSALHRDYRGVSKRYSAIRAGLFPSWERCYTLSVRVIARRTLLQFVESLKGQAGRRAVKAALDAWFHEVQRARWRNSAELKRSYGAASIVSADRVVFNIKGNDYRMVTAIDYERQIVFIKWLGPHRDYDRIDARTVKYGD
jgi:mRNA interferase HigB